ncbi:MAG: mechanosensitive ion channel family protein, partial [Candidatus Binatia bacterium]
MEPFESWLESIKHLLRVPILQVGEGQITVWTLGYLAVLVLLLIYLSGKLRLWLVDKLLTRRQLH